MFCEKLSPGGVDGHLIRERVGDVGIEPRGTKPLRVGGGVLAAISGEFRIRRLLRLQCSS